MKKLIMLASASLLVSASAFAQVTMIDDFSGGLTVDNHPNPGVFGTWYDIQGNTFGTPSLSSGAMRVDDGGFANGVYAIYNAVVPSTNNFSLAADFVITEDAGSSDAIQQLELGCVVNGTHRAGAGGSVGTDTLAAITTNVGSFTGLTAGDESGSSQMVETPIFAATAGDDILVAVGTDVQTTTHDTGSVIWGANNFYTVDNIHLRLNGLPVELDTFSVE